MDLSLLRGFLTVARCRNFHRAAEELYMTQSALTMQMMRLERELGILLFDRSGRQVTLTEAGETLQQYAPALLRDYETMCEAVNPSRLQLRVGVLPVMAFYSILDLIAAFPAEQHQIRLSLQEYANDALPDALRQGRADLIFWRCSGAVPKDFRSLCICEDELALVLPASHPMAGQQSVSLREFAEESFIFLGQNTQLYRDSLEACRLAGFQPRILFTGSSVENVGQLVHRTGCAAIFMRQVALGMRDPGLAVLHFEESSPVRLVLAASKERFPRSARLLWESVRTSLGQEKAAEGNDPKYSDP